jgi:hypothetical protein
MTNEKRLSIALENCLRTMPAAQLKALCDEQIDSLVKSLPKEAGGSKVMMEGRSHGKGTAQPTAVPSPKKAGKAVGSLNVR